MSRSKGIAKVIQLIEKTMIYLEQCIKEKDYYECKAIFSDIRNAMYSVNYELFQNDEIEGFDLRLPETSDEENVVLTEYKDWLKYIKEITEFYTSLSTNIDRDFYYIMEYVKNVSYDTIVQNVLDAYKELPEQTRKSLNMYYQKYSYMWGNLDESVECYDVITNRVSALKENYENFIWMYKHLGDYRSKNVMVCTLYSWLTFNTAFIFQMKEGNFKDYYDLDLLACDENEVMVDLGAYNGDSVLDYIDVYQKYKRIYCYEITPSSVEEIEKNLDGLDNIVIRNKGVGSHSDVMYLSSEEALSNNTVSKENDGVQIDIVSIDDDIDEEITLIKMDIEGAEKEALLGCEKHIKNEKPKLAICVYHNNEDIWKIAKMICEMREDYKFYMRSNGEQWGPSEIVLFAL